VARHSDRDEQNADGSSEASLVPGIERGAIALEEARADRPHELTIDRSVFRRPIAGRERSYSLRDTETDLLATIGTFRVVPSNDLCRAAESSDRAAADLRHLTEHGLIERHVITMDSRSSELCVLTREGKALLEAHRESPVGCRPQQYHAGLVKPRELAHDAQIYRMFRAESARITKRRGIIRRVVLDYELKREYQVFLNRRVRSSVADEQAERAAFAKQAELPLIDNHVVFPDLRIEYETPDGALAYRDVELVTEHYSRSQLAGKAAAGFGLYRSPGCRDSGRNAGATPLDPRNLDWLR
jgi:hypothetical protein